MSFISERSATVAPFRVMKILGAAHKRDDALVLCVGQPATSAPTPVIRSAHHWLDAHTLGYTPTLGIPELRQKIAEYHNANLDNVVVTTGSSGAFVALFLAVLGPVTPPTAIPWRPSALTSSTCPVGQTPASNPPLTSSHTYSPPPRPSL